MLRLAPVSTVPCTNVGEEGEGEEEMALWDRLVRRLIVTLLEVGSGVGRDDIFGGVWGVDDLSMRSCEDSEELVVWRSPSWGAVSTDLLLESPFAVRCRFLAVESSSVNGFVRAAEQGSERSRSACS